MRWGRFQITVDSIEHDREILDHVVVPEPNHTITARGNFSSTRSIFAGLIRVLAAIELDHKFLFGAGKVCDPLSDRVLASEFKLRKAFVERTPKYPFGVRGSSTKLTC